MKTRPSLNTHKILSKQTIRTSRLSKAGIVLLNLVIIVAIAFVVMNRNSSATAPAFNSQNSVAVNPLDQVSSTDIALTVATMSNLPETTAISNQAQSAAAEIAMANTSDNVVAKPEVVSTALKSRADIQTYTSQPGDTVTTLASKFGITSNSILWSNGLTSNTLTVGSQLTIPPVNGIVYTVKPGDTPASLAAKYNSNQAQIVAYNDAEINGLIPGEQIIIPNATLATGASAGTISGITAGSFPWGNGPIYGFNGYDYGFCTWYVATQIPVPSNWGNASSWAYYAALSGWNVATTPKIGAIAQTPYAAGGEGHVAIVDAVSADGSQVQIRDMNGVAGWGRVGYSGWIPVSTFVHYITP